MPSEICKHSWREPRTASRYHVMILTMPCKRTIQRCVHSLPTYLLVSWALSLEQVSLQIRALSVRQPLILANLKKLHLPTLIQPESSEITLAKESGVFH